MTNDMGVATSRMVWFSRLLLALTVALALGTVLADPVDAGKKGKKKPINVKERVQNERENCELSGGTFTVQEHDGGNTTTECEGGLADGRTCFINKTQHKCHSAMPNGSTTHATEGAAPATAGADAGGGNTTGGNPPWLGDPPILHPVTAAG